MPYPKALNHDEEREVFTAWSQDKEQVGELAGRYGVSRNTIHAAITRVLEQLQPAHREALDVERNRAISFYRYLQGLSIEAIDRTVERGKNPSPIYLAELRQCQTRVDTLMGLETPQQAQSYDVTFSIDRASRQAAGAGDGD